MPRRNPAVSIQLKRQAPGPSGWPQLPQGPGSSLAADAVPLTAAKAESFLRKSVLLQAGHSGAGADARTSFSNSLPQAAHAYS
jgi:hypothetical protein